MTWLKKTSNCSVPKANTEFILSNEYVDKTRALLIEYGEIPVISFASIWYLKYRQVIDFAVRHYDGGLTKFLRDNSHLFELKRNKSGVLLVSLISRPVSGYSTGSGELGEDAASDGFEDPATRRKTMELAASILFDPNNHLWMNKPWRKYLEKREIYINQSAFELAHSINSYEASRRVKNIRGMLSKFPEGLKSDQVYKYIDRSALVIFGISTTVNSLIDELPELFYRKRMDRTEDDLVFDGALHTVADLTGGDQRSFEEKTTPEMIVNQAIDTGLYQKTLILIYETGHKGLKINVWMKSIEMNFYAKNQKSFEHDLKDFKTMTFFLALARSGMVELRSDKVIKNDIRAFLPRQPILPDLPVHRPKDPIKL